MGASNMVFEDLFGISYRNGEATLYRRTQGI